ncbi:hypothetical protein [Hallella colorans]|nr:hypothetical protein [Hallella colorans]
MPIFSVYTKRVSIIVIVIMMMAGVNVKAAIVDNYNVSHLGMGNG